MTTFLLIRHASTDTVDRLVAGRSAGVPLNEGGRAEAERLAEKLAGVRLSVVYSSPLERALHTARAIAARQGVEVKVHEVLNEIDFGEWTGRELRDLKPLRQWHQFNVLRSMTPPPEGEFMIEVQARLVRFLNHLCVWHGRQRLALVTHGDVIRAVIVHALGMPLDLFDRLEILPASVSALRVDDAGPKVLFLNETAELFFSPGSGSGT